MLHDCSSWRLIESLYHTGYGVLISFPLPGMLLLQACIVCEGGALVERGSIGTLAHTIQPSMTLSSTENLSTVTE